MIAIVESLENYYGEKYQRGKEKFPISGIGSIALNLAAGSSDLGCDPLEKAQIQQWVEFISMYNDQLTTSVASQNILKELNSCLSRRTYIAINRKTVADIVIFFSVWNIIASLTFQEKEKYLNLSRWFSNIQNDEKIRHVCKQIPFSRTLLY